MKTYQQAMEEILQELQEAKEEYYSKMAGELVTAFNLEIWDKFRHHLSIFEELKTWQYHFTLWVTLKAKVILTVAATQSAMTLATLLNNNSNFFFLFFLKYEH